jgi:hypothetical protein
LGGMRAQPTFETIGPEILQEYLDTASDFAFELEVMKVLAAEKVNHEHGGSYVDASTSKVRQFDFRSWSNFRTYNLGVDLNLHLAIECKNLREYSPLLVHCVPRAEHESFHSILWNTGSEAGPLRCAGRSSRYPIGEPSGKSWAQVTKPTAANSRVNGSDEEIYQKWAQALASANDLLRIPGGEPPGGHRYCIALPVVVVPNAMLWMANYDENGQLTGPCRQIDHVAYFVNYDYQVPFGPTKASYTASHVEIFTLAGFIDLVAALSKTATFNQFFPDEVIWSVMASGQRGHRP